jgi:SAM-dependent methyltransferase
VTETDGRADDAADVAAYWDGQYRAGGELWGETPSELAAAVVERLRQLGPAAAGLTLLDLGCGYGRGDVALWRALGLAIVGVDGAQRAVEMARAALPAGARIDYRRGDLTDAARADSGLWDGPGTFPRMDRETSSRMDWAVPEPSGRASTSCTRPTSISYWVRRPVLRFGLRCATCWRRADSSS